MYKTAISKKPDDPFLYNNLAALYARENRGDEAAANWRTALRLNPGYGPAVVELAALYGRTGRLADAISVLEAGSEAVQAPPWGPRIRRNLAFVYLRLGEMDKARAAFRDAAASGEDALSFLGLAHETMLEGKPEDALTLLESGAVLDSTLAVPFVRAWKEPLASLVRKQETPALARILARVAVGPGRTPPPILSPSSSRAGPSPTSPPPRRRSAPAPPKRERRDTTPRRCRSSGCPRTTRNRPRNRVWKERCRSRSRSTRRAGWWMRACGTARPPRSSVKRPSGLRAAGPSSRPPATGRRFAPRSRFPSDS
jgi:Flp pilus assembly protein TadD